MDAIDRAIVKSWHISRNEKLNAQTWKEFEESLNEKKLFLFGAGRGADFYYEKYGKNACAEGIIENDNKLWGIPVQEIVSEKIYGNAQNIKIVDISVLDQYLADDIVVLISSLKHFEEIAKQLKERGIYNCFAVLPMEANERKGKTVYEREDRFFHYLKESCSQPINKKKIVFFTMCDYAGHGKEIAKQLLRIRNDLDIVWIVKDLRINMPDGIRLVAERNSRKFIYDMETAGMWICDTGIPMFMKKRDGQTYIQIKHWPSVTLKSFGFDLAKFRQEKSLIKFCEYDSKMIDYIITGSEFDTRTCRSGFAFEGEVFQAGSPRSDALFHASEHRMTISQYYHLDRTKKLLLYAPTFRSKTGGKYIPQASHIDLDFNKVKEALERKFGGSWLILLRLHPVVASESRKLDKPEYVVDVSDYYDSEELVAASDIMITDYSSIMFEPAFVKKPVFLLAVDRKEYIDGERGLLIDYEDLPFSIAESNDELIQNMERFEQKEYEEKVQQFLDEYGVHEDGHAGERAAVFVSQMIGR